ncbi:MAG: hypothetical protein AMXMBFR36_21330 [Acidobacteriota bacterium]
MARRSTHEPLDGMPDLRREVLVLDVSRVQTREELHELIYRGLEFPSYCGMNWDAFDECIRDVALPRSVEIKGLSILGSVLPRETKLLRQCFLDAAAELPGLEVRFHAV